MSQRRDRQERKRLNFGGVILSSATSLPEGAKHADAVTKLEALRDKTQAEHWADEESKRSVLFGIKLCIAVLRKADINEIT